MHVISLDEEKVWKTKIKEKIYINKISQISELQNLKLAREYINNNRIKFHNQTYLINIPNTISWNEEKNIITMDYFNGSNLENLLRNFKTRKDAILLLNQLLEYILQQNFYWTDFAPRNILINEKQRKICFVDFEKGLNFNSKNTTLFLRNHVFEEYSSFLLLNERIFDGNSIFNLMENEKQITIRKEEIKIKRVKAMAELLNYPDEFNQDSFLEIYRLFLLAEMPYINEDKEIIFPRIQLENILEAKKTNQNAYNDYAEKILELIDEKRKKMII